MKALKIFLLLSALVLSLGITRSYAWDRHHHRHGWGRASYGFHVSVLPARHSHVWVGGVRYYYDDGNYYLPDGPGYVVVNPPVGTVYRSIPAAQYQPVVINGVTYYVNNGVYYIYTQYGYQLVPQPVNVVSPTTSATTSTTASPTITTTPISTPITTTNTAQTVDTATSNASQDDAFTVNIPNDKGGYTPVAIKKTDKGFVGPQGEFYAEFPKVSQLKAMYGK